MKENKTKEITKTNSNKMTISDDVNPNLPISPQKFKWLRRKEIIIVTILSIVAVIVLVVMICILCLVKVKN